VKASGLSAGKGVVVAQTRVEACQAVTDIMTVRNINCLCFSPSLYVKHIYEFSVWAELRRV